MLKIGAGHNNREAEKGPDTFLSLLAFPQLYSLDKSSLKIPPGEISLQNTVASVGEKGSLLSSQERELGSPQDQRGTRVVGKFLGGLLPRVGRDRIRYLAHLIGGCCGSCPQSPMLQQERPGTSEFIGTGVMCVHG